MTKYFFKTTYTKRDFIKLIHQDNVLNMQDATYLLQYNKTATQCLQLWFLLALQEHSVYFMFHSPLSSNKEQFIACGFSKSTWTESLCIHDLVFRLPCNTTILSCWTLTFVQLKLNTYFQQNPQLYVNFMCFFYFN